MFRTATALACLAAASLTGCTAAVPPESPDGTPVAEGSAPAPTAAATSTASATPTGDIGPDGEGAGRFELLRPDAGGVVLDETTLTLVYRNGLRHVVDVSGAAGDSATGAAGLPDLGDLGVPGQDPVAALRAGEEAVITSAAGVTTVSPDGSAVHVDTAGAVSTLEPDGSGTVTDAAGTIVVHPDGSVVCVGAEGVQVVGADGEATSVGTAGVLVLDRDGGSTAVGADAAAGVEPAGRFSVCGIGGTMTIDLAGDVLFAFDSDELTPEAAAVVRHAAAMIREAAAGPVTVTGHTDSLGTDAYNLDLSERRAAAVVAALSAELGGDARMTGRGAGEREPVAPNTTPSGADDPEGRAQNRRVSISFLR